MEDRVFEVKDLHWTFDDKGPNIRINPFEDQYGTWKYMDPTPCHPHSREVVLETLKRCHEVFPLKTPLFVYNIHFESVGRTNGETQDISDYKTLNEFGEYVHGSVIMLFAKRTPIHPAATRALVSHEYGHAVDRAISSKRFPGSSPWEKLRQEYAELRGLPKRKFYGPGTWHDMPAELLANDFRWLVMGIEREFWPHTVPTPDKVPAVVEWWEAAKKMDLTPGPPMKKS